MKKKIINHVLSFSEERRASSEADSRIAYESRGRKLVWLLCWSKGIKLESSTHRSGLGSPDLHFGPEKRVLGLSYQI